MTTPSKTVKNAAIIAYLAIQLILPLRGFIWNKHETRGNFSWNMYSQTFQCRVRYRLHKTDGGVGRISHRELFNRPKRAAMVYHRDVLPAFHEFMCEEFRNRGDMEKITAKMSCSLNKGPRVDLVHRSVDICTAENFGVTGR